MSSSNLRTLWFALLLLAFGSALSACGATPDDDDSAGDDDDAADDDDDSAGDDDDSAGDDDDSAGDDDDSASDLREIVVDVFGVETTDSNGDGEWRSGEELIITAQAVNEGPYEHMYYPAFYLSVDSEDVSLPPGQENIFFGLVIGQSQPLYFTATATTDTAQTVTFTITPGVMNPENPCGGDDKWEPPCIVGNASSFSVELLP